MRDDMQRIKEVDWTQVDISDSRLDRVWTLLLVSTYEGRRGVAQAHPAQVRTELDRKESK